MVERLRLVRFTPAELRQAGLGDQIRVLRQDRLKLQQEYDRLRRELAKAEEYAAESEGFVTTATEQRLRLESVGLFPAGGSGAARCPLGQSEAEATLPKVGQVRKAIDTLQRNILAVGRERPDLRDFIAAKSGELTRLEEQLRVSRDTLQGIQARDAQLRSEQGRDLERMRVIGKIEMFLEGVTTAADDSEFRRQVEDARRQVADLKQQFDLPHGKWTRS